MPSPFIYDASFINAPSTDPLSGDDLLHNIQSMRVMLMVIEEQYSLTITDYAKSGIITGALLASGGNPARIRDDLVYYTEPEDPDPYYYDTYGLFQWTTPTDPPDDGVADMDRLGSDLDTGNYYYPDPYTWIGIHQVTLTQYLNSTDDYNLGILWLHNYTFGGKSKPTLIFHNTTYIEQTQQLYMQILHIIQTTPLPISAIAMAVLGKKERKWWR